MQILRKAFKGEGVPCPLLFSSLPAEDGRDGRSSAAIPTMRQNCVLRMVNNKIGDLTILKHLLGLGEK